jgi:hypothetical protein
MTPGTWEHATRKLEEETGPATPHQTALAKKVGVTFPARTPKAIAASLLRTALASELDLGLVRPVRHSTEHRLKALRRETKLAVKPANQDEALAWMVYLWQVRRKKLLLTLKPDTGDIVRLSGGELCEVSSVGDDGRLYFKGGRGNRAWPDLIQAVVARVGATGKAAATARLIAENGAAERLSSPEWSAAKSEDLAEFAVKDHADESDIDELEDVIDKAKEEKPIQQFLQERPRLLTALLGGQFRFSIPKKRLADKFIPDFVLGGVDSIGVQWVLVELETPRSGI